MPTQSNYQQWTTRHLTRAEALELVPVVSHDAVAIHGVTGGDSTSLGAMRENADANRERMRDNRYCEYCIDAVHSWYMSCGAACLFELGRGQACPPIPPVQLPKCCPEAATAPGTT